MKIHYHVTSGTLCCQPIATKSRVVKVARTVKDPHVIACDGEVSGSLCSRMTDKTIGMCPGIYDWQKPVNQWSSAPEKALECLRSGGM